MDLLSALAKLPELVAQHEAATQRIIELEKEKAAQMQDGLVGWKWICTFLDVDVQTARMMLAEEKIFAYGRKIKKFRRTDILRFVERHQVKVKELS